MSRQAAEELVNAIESWIELSRSEIRTVRTHEEVERYRENFARDLGGTPLSEIRGVDATEQLVGSSVDVITYVETEMAFWRVMRALLSVASVPNFQSTSAHIVELIQKSRRIVNSELLHIELPQITDLPGRARRLADWGNVAEHVARLEDEALAIARRMLLG